MSTRPKAPQTYGEQALAAIDRGTRKIFGLQPGWYRNLDVVKNNYQLGMMHLARGNYRDAEFRLKFLTWMDPKHADGWFNLARAQIALDKKDDARRSLTKLLERDKTHVEGRQLLAVLSGKAPAAPSLQIAPETDANVLYLVHKESFPIYWKEKEISDMLLASGTQAWSAREGSPIGMLMTRAQFEQAEILTLAIIPAARRKKIAQKLMKAAHEALAAAGVKKIFLEVAEDNMAATLLYRGLGYAEISRRAGYYKQPDGSSTDALVMAKEIA